MYYFFREESACCSKRYILISLQNLQDVSRLQLHVSLLLLHVYYCTTAKKELPAWSAVGNDFEL